MTAVNLETMRRGACPALAAPMKTGDGWLSRVALSAPIPPAALVALCAAAKRHGNGIMDISARGNLQARGLSEESTRAFEADVRALDLPLREGLPVDVSPLAGLDPTETADPRPLAARIAAAVAERGLRPRLAPKTAVIVDGGGHVPLGALLADIRLKAVPGESGPLWLVFTGGAEDGGRVLGALGEEDAAEAALLLLEKMSARGRGFRARDFDPAEVRHWLRDMLKPAPAFAASATPPRPYGLFALKDGSFALGLSPTFGQIAAAELADFCRAAESAGIGALKPAPGHALILFGPEAACRALTETAGRRGFIAGARDARAAIAACPGAPACTSASFATRPLAAAAASACGRLLDGSFMLHLSGCAKGCAHPQAALLTLSGREEGLCLTFDARASDEPLAVLPPEGALAAIERLSALVELRRGPDENAAECLTRLGPAAIAAFLTQGAP